MLLSPPAPRCKWSLGLRGEAFAPVIASDGTVFVGTNGGRLYSVAGSSAPAVSYWPVSGQNASRTSLAVADAAGDTPDNTGKGDSGSNHGTGFTPQGWAFWETFPWVYNEGTWCYMLPGEGQIFIYNYDTQVWNVMPK